MSGVVTRKMRFAGSSLSSAEWLALRGLLFGRQVTRNGQEEYVVPKDFLTPYYCEACDAEFLSWVTPMLCPCCKKPPGEQGITMEHKGFRHKTFAFFVPES